MTDAQIADSGVGTGSGPAAEPGGGPHSRWHRLRQPEALLPLILTGVFLVLWALVLARPTFLTSFDVLDHAAPPAPSPTPDAPLLASPSA